MSCEEIDASWDPVRALHLDFLIALKTVGHTVVMREDGELSQSFGKVGLADVNTGTLPLPDTKYRVPMKMIL